LCGIRLHCRAARIAIIDELVVSPMDYDAEATAYMVVVNDEQQYSIWPVARSLPLGWHDEGFHGSRAECLSHVEQVWTDMRPRSARMARTQSLAAKGGDA